VTAALRAGPDGRSRARTDARTRATIVVVMSPAGQRHGVLEDVSTLLFDVMGTVVDDEGSLENWSVGQLAAAGVGRSHAVEVVRDSGIRLARLIDHVVSGAAPWQSHRMLRTVALRQSLAAAGWTAYRQRSSRSCRR
jgi:hypothetical protein